MKKVIEQNTTRKQIKKIAKSVKRKPMCNRVQIYDLHQVLLFDLSCNKCTNQEQCSKTKKKRTHCEIDEVIITSGVFNIQAQVQGTENSKYYVYTDDCESLDIANSAVKKIMKQYSR